MDENLNFENLTYEKAMSELSGIADKIENSENSFEQIEKDIKYAMELIKFCKEKLSGYKERFDAIQKQNEAA